MGITGKPQKFVAGLIQMAMARDPATNLEHAIHWIREAAAGGAAIVCLPEPFRSQYFCQSEEAARFDLAEPAPGPTTGALAKVAAELKIVVVAPVFERRAAGLYHTSAVVLDTDGRIAGLYRKMHIPDDPGYYEKFYFTPGDLGFVAVDTPVASIGVLICWDQWFPEAARLTALQGAELLFYPTAIGWHPHEREEFGATQQQAWQTVQRGHAIANGVYVAAVNRVGHETPEPGAPGIEFWGSSFVCDPQGVLLAQAATDREDLILAEIDLGRVEEVRRHWPFLRDRRIEAYHGIARRFLREDTWSRTQS